MFSLTVSDLTPNVGLNWYFFTEMFDHFRSFFVGAFQVGLHTLRKRERESSGQLIKGLLRLTDAYRDLCCTFVYPVAVSTILAQGEHDGT